MCMLVGTDLELVHVYMYMYIAILDLWTLTPCLGDFILTGPPEEVRSWPGRPSQLVLTASWELFITASE